MTLDLDKAKIAIVGLGYVGLPLAVEFGKHRPVVGFDIKKSRVAELLRGEDVTLEATAADLEAAVHLTFTSNVADLRDCQVFIVTVPTPVDRANRPDLDFIKGATESVAAVMQKGAVIVYESTVYPGCTREICVPILERTSGLKFNEDFFVGYSPERINPGDHAHRLPSIVKVTSGSTPDAADAIDGLYAGIITAGTHKAPSIEVAEAAKVIENTQRDLNIALMNELSIIFGRMHIDTGDVLAAAGTKWNFLRFKPGLVGGHCIGVDPYYLTHKAQELGHHPDVILAGRRINDLMGRHVADQVARLMMSRSSPVVGSRILVMGLTFKEDCPDIRNSKVLDVVHELESMNAQVDVWDDWASDADARAVGVRLIASPAEGVYDGIVIAVAHKRFVELGVEQIRRFGSRRSVLFDVKGIFPKSQSDGRL